MLAINGRNLGPPILETRRAFAEAVPPIVIAIATGDALRRAFPLDLPTLNRVSIYGLSPCLRFVTLPRRDRAERGDCAGVDRAGAAEVGLQAAMPTAVNITIVALEFNAWPQFVSNVVVAITPASMHTHTLLVVLR